MLDIADFIVEKGGDPKIIQESQRRRYCPENVVEEVQRLYNEHRTANYAESQKRAEVKAVQAQIAKAFKANGNADGLQQEKKELQDAIKTLQKEAKEAEEALQKAMRPVGNLVHDSVPIHNDEEHNVVVRTWGSEILQGQGQLPAPAGESSEPPRAAFQKLPHHEVLQRIGGYDPERGQKIAGHRGYCLKGPGVFLNDALASYGKQFLYRKGYETIQPPYFMQRDFMARTAQLEQFDEELYKIDGGETGNDLYLIATSEQPISALHAGEWMQAKDLPIKYAGFSTCFRKEAGAHGKDNWGIFRVHQFEKIEQFVFTKPEDSWQAFDDMITTSEEFYQSLRIPYQVVAIVSGALNNAAAKKYDLEAWFPYQQAYKELVSCSNCTDYQARALDIRYGVKQQTETRKQYVHALNSTLCATERALCCILENYQEEDGVRVPQALRRFMPDELQEFIPYGQDLVKEPSAEKVIGKAPRGKSKALPTVDAAVRELGKAQIR